MFAFFFTLPKLKKNNMSAFVNLKNLSFFFFPQGEQGLPGAAGQDGPPGPLVSTTFFCCYNSRNEIVYKLESLKFCLVNWFIYCRVFKEVYHSDQSKKRKIILTDKLLGKYALDQKIFPILCPLDEKKEIPF